MSAERLRYLFQKNTSQQATRAEKEELMGLLADESHEALAKELFENTWNNFGHTTDTFTEQESEQLFYDIQGNIADLPETRRKIIAWWRYAAAASVLLLLSFGLYLTTQRVNPVDNVGRLNPMVTNPNRATLILGDGRRIDLDGAHSGTLSKEAGINIYKDADGRITYQVQASAANASGAMRYNTTETPRGGEWHLILADGTNVWLNAASSIRYPVQFTGADRIVELSGEAYFEVAKNPEKPFIVHTGQGNIRVLGTHFNVNAYQEENMKTTLLEGSVELSHGSDLARLRPGDQGTISDASTGIRVEQVNTDDAVAWKKGYFILKHKPITEIMKELSRWYDIDVAYQGDIKDRAFEGMYSKTKPLQELLSALEYTGTVHFKTEGRRVIVMP